MQKKRVGVITFHNYDNYGAILQSYALQKKLQEIGKIGRASCRERV